MKRLVYFLPLVLALAGIGLFFLYMQQINQGKDIQALDSARVGKPIPDFSLSSLENESRTLNPDDLKGRAGLLNVWATWCPSCRVEHPWLLKIANEYAIPVFGLNYKDDREAALIWLQKLGNPYQFNIFDDQGRLGFELGVYGAPETYIFDKNGVIHMRHVGVVDERVWLKKIKPLIDQLNAQ
jgi:cytochrome c biogenesis protein CcmG/thiol:disulfide interchange protein DsbE